MFSGIVEAQAIIKSFRPRADVFELILEKPPEYDDLSLGDSVAVNGVCLTVEASNDQTVQFAVAQETLNVTGWGAQNPSSAKSPLQSPVNLERSLRIGDRIHGHVVQGHVDAMAEVVELNRQPESAGLTVRIPSQMAPFVWKKGSLTVNGVSLTVNTVEGTQVGFWLIPETLKRTNLGALKPGDFVTIEADSYARFLFRQRELELE